MISQLSPVISEVGVIAGVVIAVGGAATLISRWIKGLFHRAICEVDERVKIQTDPILKELSPNGGFSLRDAVDRMEYRLAVVEKIVQVDADLSVTERHDDAVRRG
jgi:hypothetical protein